MPDMPDPGELTEPGTLLTIAPAATDLPHLLRTAIDAEQVGAARIHLAPDQPDAERAVAAIRTDTRLVITADPGATAEQLADRPGPGFVEVVLPGTLTGPDVLLEVARIASEHPGNASVGARGPAALPVLLAALAVGLHLRVGTADLTGPPPRPGPGSTGSTNRTGSTGTARHPAGPREDVALIARAAGLARIAGRPAMPLRDARAMLGLD